jgi:hypothetical protein
MDVLPTPSASATPCPTQHALLVCWGHFARQLGLPQQFTAVPSPQKTVKQAPAAKLLTLLLGLLAGHEFLSDLRAGLQPVTCDPSVAAAWGCPPARRRAVSAAPCRRPRHPSRLCALCWTP